MSQPALDQDIWEINEALLELMSDEEVNRLFELDLHVETTQFCMVPLVVNKNIEKEFHEEIFNFPTSGVSYQDFEVKYTALQSKIYHQMTTPRRPEDRIIRNQMNDHLQYFWAIHSLENVKRDLLTHDIMEQEYLKDPTSVDRIYLDRYRYFRKTNEETKTWCENTIFQWETSRHAAVCMSLHPRLGMNSPLQQLSEDIFTKIKGYF